MKKKPLSLADFCRTLSLWQKKLEANAKDNTDLKFLAKVFIPQLITQLQEGLKISEMCFNLDTSKGEAAYQKNIEHTVEIDTGQALILNDFTGELKEAFGHFDSTTHIGQAVKLIEKILQDGNSDVGICFAAHVHLKATSPAGAISAAHQPVKNKKRQFADIPTGAAIGSGCSIPS